MTTLQRLKICLCIATGFGFAAAAVAAVPVTPSGPIKVLIRYPALHGNSVVFEASGNLWKTTLSGGVASQLTSDSGFDMAPHFSPDGHWIAFTGWYQGNTDVYIIPATGGPVHRLTFHSINSDKGGKLEPSPDNVVVGWTPNGQDVVFLSRRSPFPGDMQAYEVPVSGGLPTRLPLPWTGPLSFNSTGTTVAYNKLARALRPFHRKHYYAGQAQDIWTYDFKTGVSQQITHWKGADVWPMWDGNTLYFTSDRGPNGVQNLWSYSFKTKQFIQLTHFKTYDIDWPSLGNNGIVFSDGGKLSVYALPSGRLTQVSVRVPLDGTRLLPYWAETAKNISSADIAPNGELAVFSARGALYTVPSKYGDTKNLTDNSGADQRAPAWSPDGMWIAYIDDVGSNSEIYIRPPATGNGKPRALTHTDDVSYQGRITWSPDSKWITYVDSSQVLWMENVDNGKRYQVAQDKYYVIGSFPNVSWSPHSGWIAFSKTLPNRIRGLFLYRLSDHSLHQISEGRFNDSTPIFSQNGKYLYFISSRIVNPAESSFDPDVMASIDSQGLYVATLRNGLLSPFALRSESPLSTEKDQKNEASNNGKQNSDPLHIALQGLMDRAVQVPVPPAGNFGSVAAVKGVLYFTTKPNRVLGGTLPGEKSVLHAYDLSKRKEITLARRVSSFVISADDSTLLYQHQRKWQLRPATFNKGAKTDTLNLSQMRLWVQPRAEWNTIFGEAWRDVRDYFFNPQYAAKEWPAIGERYRRLLPLVASRQDLTWVIGNMIGSPGESHMFVRGGAHAWRSPSSTTADLGATFALNAASGRYYLAHIYRGDNMIPGYRSPLNQPGLKVKQGDYVMAINGHALEAPTNPYSLLMNTYGTAVELLLADNPRGANAWTVDVRPVVNDTKLHMLAWIRHNAAIVNRLSHGKIGYVYIHDEEATGMREFVRQYYSQLNKPGLIFDVRWNPGGSIDPLFFDRLDRSLVGMYTLRQGMTHPLPNAYPGYMAALINRGSASDGDVFAYMFEKDHLGPTIGSRTWGGVRGLNNVFSLLDGGSLVVSEHGLYGLNSQWVVENIGVFPDVTVHDKPGDLDRGHNAQLETAVRMLMKKINSAPRNLPPPPPWTPAFPPQPAYPKCTDHLNSTTCGG